MKAEIEGSERIADAVRKIGGVASTATACGVTEQAVYNWLAGTRPYAKSLRRLAEAAGVSVGWLNHESEAESPVLTEPAPVYGALPVPSDLRGDFVRFAASYGMTQENAFRLIFDSFTGRIRKQF